MAWRGGWQDRVKWLFGRKGIWWVALMLLAADIGGAAWAAARIAAARQEIGILQARAADLRALPRVEQADESLLAQKADAVRREIAGMLERVPARVSVFDLARAVQSAVYRQGVDLVALQFGQGAANPETGLYATPVSLTVRVPDAAQLAALAADIEDGPVLAQAPMEQVSLRPNQTVTLMVIFYSRS